MAIDISYLKRIEGVTRMDRISNKDIRKLEVEAVLAVADRKKERA